MHFARSKLPPGTPILRKLQLRLALLPVRSVIRFGVLSNILGFSSSNGNNKELG